MAPSRSTSPALLAYIAQRFPHAGLAPLHDRYAFAEVQSFNNYLCSTIYVAHAHKPRASRWADDEAAIESMRRKVPETMGASFELIENEMFEGPWLMGENYSICDPYLFTLSRWLERNGVDIARFPKVQAHMRRMSERPAVIKALASQ